MVPHQQSRQRAFSKAWFPAGGLPVLSVRFPFRIMVILGTLKARCEAILNIYQIELMRFFPYDGVNDQKSFGLIERDQWSYRFRLTCDWDSRLLPLKLYLRQGLSQETRNSFTAKFPETRYRISRRSVSGAEFSFSRTEYINTSSSESVPSHIMMRSMFFPPSSKTKLP